MAGALRCLAQDLTSSDMRRPDAGPFATPHSKEEFPVLLPAVGGKASGDPAKKRARGSKGLLGIRGPTPISRG